MRASTTTPRIASGNCSLAPPAIAGTTTTTATVSSTPSSNDVYEKQLAWKQLGQSKVQRKAQDLSSREEFECTFAPQVRWRVVYVFNCYV